MLGDRLGCGRGFLALLGLGGAGRGLSHHNLRTESAEETSNSEEVGEKEWSSRLGNGDAALIDRASRRDFRSRSALRRAERK